MLAWFRKMRWLGSILAVVIFWVYLTACAARKITLLNGASMTTEKLEAKDLNNRIVAILVDDGLDIKMSNPDVGLVTTEYKKVGSFGDNPPFDVYLQIKVRIKELSTGKVRVQLTPQIKESNRLNAAAFNEHALWQFTTEEQEKSKKLPDRAQANLAGFLLFMKVAQHTAEVCGLEMQDLQTDLQIVDLKSQ